MVSIKHNFMKPMNVNTVEIYTLIPNIVWKIILK